MGDICPNSTKIAVLGTAYKGDVDDSIPSPTRERKIVEENFNTERRVDRIIQLYERLVL